MRIKHFAVFGLCGFVALAQCANALTLPAVVEDGTTFHADTLYVIANTNDGTSVFLAQQYMRKRGIPSANLIKVALPVRPEISAAEAAPLKAAVDQATGARHFAIAWSMPYRVGLHQSITSYVSMGYLDPAKHFTKACNDYVPYNPYYFFGNAGDTNFKTGAGLGPSFDNAYGSTERYKPTVGFKPSMLLASSTSYRPQYAQGDPNRIVDPVQAGKDPASAYLYAKGALDVIDRGLKADGKWYGGTMYLLKTADPARNTRAPLMRSAQTKYGGYVGIQYLEQETLTNKSDILAYMTGSMFAKPSGGGTNVYLPGAVADSLTSYSGRLYDSNGQMSILEFLAAGATASYGTVREPCNYTAKFPDPRVYTQRLLSGDNVIEAYWKSVYWPAEGLFVGEPLALPYNRMKVDYENGVISIVNKGGLSGYYDVFVAGQLVKPDLFLKYEQPVKFLWSDGTGAPPKVRIVLKKAANFPTT